MSIEEGFLKILLGVIRMDVVVVVFFVTLDGYVIMQRKKVKWGEIFLPFERKINQFLLEERAMKWVTTIPIAKYLPPERPGNFEKIGESGNGKKLYFRYTIPVRSNVFDGSNFSLISAKEFPQFCKKIPRAIRPFLQKILKHQTDLSSFLEVTA